MGVTVIDYYKLCMVVTYTILLVTTNFNYYLSYLPSQPVNLFSQWRKPTEKAKYTCYHLLMQLSNVEICMYSHLGSSNGTCSRGILQSEFNA